MSSFNERLARLADDARALEGGEKLSRSLLGLASDADAYLEQQARDRHGKGAELFVKWNEFLNSSVEEAYRYGANQLVIERRKMARSVASDLRWQGGYADALSLLESE